MFALDGLQQDYKKNESRGLKIRDLTGAAKIVEP